VVEVYVCPTFDAIVSALQQGFVGQEGLMWYPNYKPDSAGWLPKGQGRPGGHALMAYGAVKNPHTGEWGILTRNSWTEGWGVHGNCIIPESAFGRDIGGFWVVRAVTETASVAELHRKPLDSGSPSTPWPTEAAMSEWQEFLLFDARGRVGSAHGPCLGVVDVFRKSPL
jgi:hypothetical protein